MECCVGSRKFGCCSCIKKSFKCYSLEQSAAAVVSNRAKQIFSKMSRHILFRQNRVWWYLHFFPAGMFSLDNNVMTDDLGSSLKQFTPFAPVGNCCQTAWSIHWCNPIQQMTIAMHISRFCSLVSIREIYYWERLSCTRLFPDSDPLPPWSPLVQRHAVAV